MTHHIAGDTINVASRLCYRGPGGRNLVGQTTYNQAIGFFFVRTTGARQGKGKSKPIQVYRLLAPKELPKKTHRISGLRAALIGRAAAMATLAQAVDRLFQGTGTFIAICGEAGTGKSRLLEEFKATLDLKAVNWIEGHAYNYTQNISYYPLINLLNRELGIEESDTPEDGGGKA